MADIVVTPTILNLTDSGQPIEDEDLFSCTVYVRNNGSRTKKNVVVSVPNPYMITAPDWWYSVDNGANWINAKYSGLDDSNGILIISSLAPGEANTFIYNINGRGHSSTPLWNPTLITSFEEFVTANKELGRIWLQFNCESADYPVFRDFKYPAPANRAIKFPVTLKKDTSNILAKLEIIDPSDDPLIDTSTSALATETADNNTDEQEIGINYKSSSARELILRISCMAASGNVYVDISRIEQLMSVPKIID